MVTRAVSKEKELHLGREQLPRLRLVRSYGNDRTSIGQNRANCNAYTTT